MPSHSASPPAASHAVSAPQVWHRPPPESCAMRSQRMAQNVGAHGMQCHMHSQHSTARTDAEWSVAGALMHAKLSHNSPRSLQRQRTHCAGCHSGAQVPTFRNLGHVRRKIARSRIPAYQCIVRRIVRMYSCVRTHRPYSTCFATRMGTRASIGSPFAESRLVSTVP